LAQVSASRAACSRCISLASLIVEASRFYEVLDSKLRAFSGCRQTTDILGALLYHPGGKTTGIGVA
jgi:hypothetical protein